METDPALGPRETGVRQSLSVVSAWNKSSWIYYNTAFASGPLNRLFLIRVQRIMNWIFTTSLQ